MLWGLSLLQGLAILGCCRGWKYQRDDRDASVAPLGDGLLVGPSVGHDQDAGLEESSLDLKGPAMVLQPAYLEKSTFVNTEC